jgi:carnitine-CoA ligase
VPLDPRLTDVELRALLEHAEPAATILPPNRARLADASTGRTVMSPSLAAPDSAEIPEPRPPLPAGAPVAVLYTSGSTGVPKGCMLTHASFVVPTGAFASRLGLRDDDVFLHVLPLHHMAGLSFLASAMHCGAHVILRPRFSGSRFWRDVARYRITVFRHLGEMLGVLCARPDGTRAEAVSLRVIYGGGATAHLAEQFTRRFGVPVVEGYGLSETNTLMCNRLGEEIPGTLGEPLPHVSIRLVDRNGEEVVGAGLGELWVRRNPATALGYFASPEVTRRAFVGAWFRTGDLVRRDAAGRLAFLGRSDEVIRRRGENIDPAEIEAVLRSCPGVRQAAAVGLPGAFGGTELAAFVEPAEGAIVDEEEVLDTCTQRLATFKRPRVVHVLERLPRTATEKVNRGELRTLAAKFAPSTVGAAEAQRGAIGAAGA